MLRQRVGKVCVWELVPLFDVAQPTVSHHLKVLRNAGLVDSERRGPWVDHYVRPDALDELSGWLRWSCARGSVLVRPTETAATIGSGAHGRPHSRLAQPARPGGRAEANTPRQAQ